MERLQARSSWETACPECHAKGNVVAMVVIVPDTAPVVYRLPGDHVPFFEISTCGNVTYQCPTCGAKFRERMIVERVLEEPKPKPKPKAEEEDREHL